ncbi:hypothetical protein IWW50_006649, partial [Coemansia erecta]
HPWHVPVTHCLLQRRSHAPVSVRQCVRTGNEAGCRMQMGLRQQEPADWVHAALQAVQSRSLCGYLRVRNRVSGKWTMLGCRDRKVCRREGL